MESIILCFSTWSHVIWSKSYPLFYFCTICFLVRHRIGFPSLFIMCWDSYGGKVETKWVCHTCVLYIGGLKVAMDLVLLDISTFDVILGMDWLAQHHAKLDCYLNKVTFQTPCGSYLSFYNDRRLIIISPIWDLDDKWSRKNGG